MKSILILALISFGVFAANATEKTTVKSAPQVIDVAVTEKGFVPDKINVKSGTHVILKVTRKTDSTCATQIKISNQKMKKDLPLNKEVSVDIGTLEKGKIGFACGMDMISGFIVAE